ncbi:glycoside hydrolase family 38 N-terminal domain-containing protein [Nonomuraea turcica]|uniref:glycoside hydrolase family 38 N-terminal domain-containing protein n=1 Tax=Nonomuraea sp. G32 TaxID=3067274 RepID=UPI00273BC255|nr:glycoside hydrolase family 38 C-terminal domain-containing protein [Nonomuraea sp. G32]MDP4503693.1 glycoside hydrolase family 38 C-terminal domain-containing protein [Nonomuraea sp. G32]
MTSRLLQRSLGSPDYDGIRQALRDDTSTPVISVRGLEVRVAVLPLFTHDGRQAVRVSSTEPLTHVLVGVDSASGRDVTLLVPEVDAPRVLTLESRDDAGVVGSARITVTPQRKWSVYVVHHSHLDIGYTDPQGTVLRHHLDYLDAALRLAEETASWPDDAKFRWTVESSMPAVKWLAARPAEMVESFVRRGREGVIEVTALPFQLHTEACSTEELHRQLRFTRRFGFPVTSAMHTDVPGAVVGLVDALSQAGVRYLAAAHNWAGRSVPYLHGGDKLTRPFRWRAPSGNELIVWFTDTPHGMAYMEGNTVGLTDSYELAGDLLPRYLSALATRGYPYGPGTFGWQGPDAPREPYELDVLHLRVQGAHADNAGPSIVPASIARRWNEEWAYPRLRSAVNSDFFQHVEERYLDRLAVHKGDWTDWWADGLGSGARPLGYVRRAQSALRVAETLHTLAGADATEEIDAAYDKVALFNEHTWGAANPWEDAEEAGDSGGLQWTRKSSGAYQAQDDAADLLHAAVRRFAAALSEAGTEGGPLASFAVFNPATRARTDVVRTFLPRDVVGVEVPIALVDARTGETVPHHEEFVDPDDWPTRPIGRHVHAVVPDVPGYGYVRLDVVPGEAQAPEPVDLGDSPAIENEFYRVAYDVREGYISSIFDKRAGRELVNGDAAAGFGQYVYDQYATAPHFNHLSGHVGAHDRTLLGDRAIGRHATITKCQRTAIGEKLVVELHGKGVDWIRTTIELHYGVPRLDLTYQLAKQGTPAKEAVFLAFPFAAGAATAWELTGGVGGPDVPRVPGSAEYMLPIRHWIAFEDPELTIAWATLEAPLVQLGTIHMPYAPFPPTLDHEDGTVYSWALNNIWDTNFPAQQQGETTFRYTVTSSLNVAGSATSLNVAGSATSLNVAGSATEAGARGRRLGAAAAAGLIEPFVGALITDSPAATETYASVDHPDVLITSIGKDSVRLQSLAAEPVEATITMPGREPVEVRLPACGVAVIGGRTHEDR